MANTKRIDFWTISSKALQNAIDSITDEALSFQSRETPDYEEDKQKICELIKKLVEIQSMATSMGITAKAELLQIDITKLGE